MMVISDDEEDIIEMKQKTKGEVKHQQRERIIPIQYEGINSSSEDDIHVIEEVVKKKKGGVTIGSFGMYEDSPIYSSSARRRVKPDLGVVKCCTMKRTNSPSTLRCMNMRRKFFLIQREQSVRLEERMNYLKLIQSLLVESSRIILHTILPSSSQSLPKQRNTSQVCKQIDVEFVDLTSDSENDTIDVEKAYSDSGSEVQKEFEGSIVQVNDIVELSNNMRGSSCKEQMFEKVQPPKSFRTDTSSDSDDNNDEVIDLVEDSEYPTNSSASKKSPSIEVRDPRVNLEEQMLQQMNIVDNTQEVIDLIDDDQISDTDVSPECVADEDDEHKERGVLSKLTEEMQILVLSAFQTKSNEVLVEGFNLVIRSKDIHTLKGSNWLNDEVINFYMCLLMERGRLSNYPSVYCFNTFFYVKLAESDHASLKRWTRKIDIFAYDLIIVPVHLKVHWCLACINFPEKRIAYYDSMFGKNEKCGLVLMNYLKEEHQDKKNKPFNCSRWKIVCVEDIPEQLNGSDCGVFACTYAEYICRLAKFTFTQRDMPYFRVKMAYEILTKKLLL